LSTVAIAGDMLPWWAMMSSVIGAWKNLRIDIDAPSIASGGMMILTRLPSGSRASTERAGFIDTPTDARDDAGRDIINWASSRSRTFDSSSCRRARHRPGAAIHHGCR